MGRRSQEQYMYQINRVGIPFQQQGTASQHVRDILDIIGMKLGAFNSLHRTGNVGSAALPSDHICLVFLIFCCVFA